MNLKHIAIIMDGNGRWATQRNRPRTFGHRAGVKSVRESVQTCLRQGVPHLTLFAFSSENWSRPAKEVQRLMELFMRALKKETPELLAQGVQQNFIGDLSRFSEPLQKKMHEVSIMRPDQLKLQLNIAVNYGGQWDVLQACQKLAHQVENGLIQSKEIDQALLAEHMSLADQPDVDLLIRTGGEHRISNFLLWQIAYAELFFESALWPDFDEAKFTEIIRQFTLRERRFGQTSEQVNA